MASGENDILTAAILIGYQYGLSTKSGTYQQPKVRSRDLGCFCCLHEEQEVRAATGIERRFL